MRDLHRAVILGSDKNSLDISQNIKYVFVFGERAGTF